MKLDKKTLTLLVTGLVSLALNVLGGTGVIDPVVAPEPPPPPPCDCTCEEALLPHESGQDAELRAFDAEMRHALKSSPIYYQARGAQ